MLLAAAGSALVFLAVLACPVGMGLMMLFMGRGMMGGHRHDEMAHSGEVDDSSLAQVKAEHARLGERIEALEAESSNPPEPAEDGAARSAAHASESQP